jgi:hypothetical protein
MYNYNRPNFLTFPSWLSLKDKTIVSVTDNPMGMPLMVVALWEYSKSHLYLIVDPFEWTRKVYHQ